MKIAMPHWISVVMGVLALICGALAAQNTFPSLTPAFAAIAGVCGLLAAPNVSTKVATLILIVTLAGLTNACNAAQRKTAVQDIPTDLSAVACIAVQALGGAAVPAIAVTCAVPEEQVANELWTLMNEGQSQDAGTGAQIVAAKLQGAGVGAKIDGYIKAKK